MRGSRTLQVLANLVVAFSRNVIEGAGGQFGSEVVDLLDLTGFAHAFDQIRCYGRGGAVIRNCPQNLIEF